jgi:hypothetical protein
MFGARMSTGTICLSCRAWLGDCQCGNTIASDDGVTPNEHRELQRKPVPRINLAVARAVRWALVSGEFHRTRAGRE